MDTNTKKNIEKNTRKNTINTKQNEIIQMFDEIATTYDTTNRVMSMGIDISWRKEACKEALQIVNKESLDIADIACGTGDMMLHWQESCKLFSHNLTSIIGIDPSSGMLKQAREKIPNGIFEVAQANNLPLESHSKDIVSIAYGLRNVVERQRALAEFYRVLRPGGVLVILEFTAPSTHTIMSRAMQFYTNRILPCIGGLISRNFKAYRYLPDSIQGFATKEKLEEELHAQNLKVVFAKSYSANVSTLLIAQKGKEQG